MTQGILDADLARLRSENAALKELLAVHEQTVLEQSDRIEHTLSTLRQKTADLESAESRIRTIMDNAADGIICVDESGLIQSVNKAAEQMFGYSAQEAVKQRIGRLLPDADSAAPRGPEGTESIITWGDRTREVNGRRKDGSTFPLELRFSCTQIDGNRLLTGIVRDITRRRQSEEKLAEMNKRLVAASREAGMAEIATGVLHNVGNVLNSVNVSATLVSDKIRSSKVVRLADAVKLIDQNADDLGEFFRTHEKGRLLPGFLKKLAAHLLEEQEAIIEELAALTRNIEHIKCIVSTQQAHAGTAGLIESTSIVDAASDAIVMSAMSFDRYGIIVERDFAEVPTLPLDRQKFLQIMINLIRNAKHAIIDGPGEVKKLTIRIAPCGEDAIQIEVRDTGVGIAPSNLTRIFSHGFTTKKDGHGFGLHSAALAAKEMGGSLSASSDGPGTGASFLLTLPLKPPGDRK